jgi:hypothetical protein
MHEDLDACCQRPRNRAGFLLSTRQWHAPQPARVSVVKSARPHILAATAVAENWRETKSRFVLWTTWAVTSSRSLNATDTS